MRRRLPLTPAWRRRAGGPSLEGMRSTWFSPRAVVLHVAVVFAVPGFCWLGWWQLHRALGGNGLSWAYVAAWPSFALYAIYMWWRLVHDAAGDRPARPAPHDSAADDRALEDYNRYLASLNDSGEAKRW